MKTYLYILIALLTLASCSENKEATQLFAQVETLIDEHPDSALTLLDCAHTSALSYPRSQRMRYELLRAKAQNKAYVDFTTDSVMREVVEYYDSHGTANEQVEAHYLLGCTYRDMHEAPAALNCYLDAVECADTLSKDCDYGLLMRVYGQMAKGYEKQVMPDKELEALSLFKKYALCCDDYFSYALGYESESVAYLQMSDTVNAIHSIKKAVELYKKYGSPKYAARAIHILIPVFISQNKISETQKIMTYYEKESGLMDAEGNIAQGRELYYNYKGMYYLLTNHHDSAEYYYRKLYKFGYNYEASDGLLKVFEAQLQPDSICKYSHLKDIGFEQSFSKLHTQAMMNSEGLFNYTRNQKIATTKIIEAERNRLYVVICCALGFVSVLIVTIVSLHFYSKKKRDLKMLNDQLCVICEKLQKSQNDYNLMETNLAQLKIQKYEEIMFLKKEYEEVSSKLEKYCRKEVVGEIQDSQIVSSLLEKEKVTPNHHVTIPDENWKELQKTIQDKLPRLYTNVILNTDLSEQEKKIAILTVLNFGTKSISILLNSSQSNVSNAKSTINKKLYNASSAKDLMRNLLNS